MLKRIDALRWGGIAVISAGCTTLAGLDEDYVPVGASGTSGTRSNAGTSSGGFGGADGSGGVLGSSSGGTGAAGAIGSTGSAGNGGVGAIAGSDGSGGTPSCPADEKFCYGNCVAPSPANGCGPTTCDACPTPNIDHVEVWCNEAQTPLRCDVRCAPGYVPDSGRCVEEGTVGTGGTGGGGNGGSAGGGSGGTGGTGGTSGSSGMSGSGGSGGSGGRCSPNTCPPCPLPDGKIPCCAPSGRCGCGYPVIGSFYCI